MKKICFCLSRKHFKLIKKLLILIGIIKVLQAIYYFNFDPTFDLMKDALLKQNITRFKLSCPKSQPRRTDPVAKKLRLITNLYFRPKSSVEYTQILASPTFCRNRFKYCMNLLNLYEDYIPELYDEPWRNKWCIQELLLSVHAANLNISSSSAAILRSLKSLVANYNYRELHNLTSKLHSFLPKIESSWIESFVERQNASTTYVIISCVNRKQNLRVLLRKLNGLLMRQFVKFRIIVAEQWNSEAKFNKGRLYNMAFKYVRENLEEPNVVGGRSCFIFHDVDLTPQHDFNLYECDDEAENEGNNGQHVARHLSIFVKKNAWKVYRKFNYELLVGGVLAVRPSTFELINGYSNEYWAWGGEDDGKC